MKKAHLRRSKRCFIFLPFGIAVALKRTPEQTLGFPTKCILVIFSNLRVDAGGKKNSSQGGAHKIIPWSTAQFCPGPVPAPTHRHRLQRAFEGYPDQIFAHSKRIVAGRCVNMAWQCMEGNVRQRHAHWSFQRITRALFVFTLNAAAANLYSLYSLCRLKPAQKSSVGLNFAIPSEPLRMARLSGKDCAKWNAEIAKGETVWNVHRQFLPGLNAWVGKHNIMSFGCRFSIIILGRHAPHQVGIKLGHTGPPMKAFRMRRSGLGPRCKKSTGVARRNYELSDLVYLPKKRLYIISFHCNSYLLLIYFFDSVPQGYASNPHKRQNHVIMY